MTSKECFLVEKIIDFAKAKEKIESKIGDKEINSLFWGLLKIIKKSASQNANQELKEECEQARANFSQTLKELHDREIELKKEIIMNKTLTKKVESQQKQICLLVKLFMDSNSNKIRSLKSN